MLHRSPNRSLMTRHEGQKVKTSTLLLVGELSREKFSRIDHLRRMFSTTSEDLIYHLVIIKICSRVEKVAHKHKKIKKKKVGWSFLCSERHKSSISDAHRILAPAECAVVYRNRRERSGTPPGTTKWAFSRMKTRKRHTYVYKHRKKLLWLFHGHLERFLVINGL